MVPTDVAAEVELVRSLVAKQFPIYDVKVTVQAVTVFISVDRTTLDEKFEALRREMNEKMFVPFLTYSGGEYTVTVYRKQINKVRGHTLNLILLFITFGTTIFAGATLWAAYENSDQWLTPDSIFWGAIFFAVPLMLILGTHELSHYYMSKRHGVAASLPFFIPSFPPLGTFGAFISMRDPIPNRKALFDIGIAGPIGGILIAIPVTLLGLYLTALDPHIISVIPDGGLMRINTSLLYDFLQMMVPIPGDAQLHPMAFAGWVGILVTAINLLPAGQLDGGHVARGLLGDNAKYLTYAVIGALLVMGMFYTGWLIFGFLILILGLRHPAPLNDISPIGGHRKIVGAIAIVLLLVTFTPTPMEPVLPSHTYTVYAVGGNATVIAAGSNNTVQLLVNNTGDLALHMRMDVRGIPAGWSVAIYPNNASANATSSTSYLLSYGGSQSIDLRISVPFGADPGIKYLYIDSGSYNSAAVLKYSLTTSYQVTVI
ncbi:MAG: site-2 protease family protein [Methanomassiliicoccales archaeon]